MDKDSWVKKCIEIVVDGHWGDVDHKRHKRGDYRVLHILYSVVWRGPGQVNPSNPASLKSRR